MKQIDVDDVTYEKLAFAARIAGLTIPEVISRLTSPFAGQANPGPVPPEQSEIHVYVVYKGTRIDGALDLRTERLRLIDGPSGLVGREFRSPTQAAVETVKVLNPDRERPETNGWRFWKDAATDRIIDQLR